MRHHVAVVEPEELNKLPEDAARGPEVTDQWNSQTCTSLSHSAVNKASIQAPSDKLHPVDNTATLSACVQESELSGRISSEIELILPLDERVEVSGDGQGAPLVRDC